MTLPSVGERRACPNTTATFIDTGHASGPFLGSGPVYPGLVTLGIGTQAYDGQGSAHFSHFGRLGPWDGIKTLWVISPSYDGSALVRGRQIDGTGDIRFSVEGFGSLGSDTETAKGVEIGEELRLDVGSTTQTGWREFPTAILFKGAGCYGLQIDGEDFSNLVVFQAAP